MVERWLKLSKEYKPLSVKGCLPNDNILDATRSKAFNADYKLNVCKMTISLFDRVENTVRKGENAGYQHFLLFPQCFPKQSFLHLLKVGIV